MAFSKEINDFLFKHQGIITSDRKIAVFDADGTLWRGDAGDVFFEYQVKNNLFNVPGASTEQLVKEYEDILNAGDCRRAYEKVIEWNAGAKEDHLRAWIKDCWSLQQSKNRCQPIEVSRQLVNTLQSNDFEVWVVSASNWWLVSHAVSEFGIPEERVIAGKLEVYDGLLTDRWQYPLPYRQSKTTAIRDIIGVWPRLVAGNSMGDYEMMLLAQDLVLVINTAKKGDPYYETEQELAQNVPVADLVNGSSATWVLSSGQ